MNSDLNLLDKDLFLFDVDGVLYTGKEKVQLVGGIKVTERLRQLGKRFFILTNISTHSRTDILRNLTSLGFTVAFDQILTSTQLTSDYLLKRYGPVRCYLIGEEGFRKELEANGHVVTDEKPDFVVVGLDRHLTYKKLDEGLRLLRGGAKLVASHVARVYMSDTGPAMAPGPIAKALEYGSARRAVAVGKPSPLMFKLAMERAGARPERTVMVGDQLDTDIEGPKKLGIYTVLVLTGVDSAEKASRAPVRPDLILRNVDDLVPYLAA